MGFHQVSTEEAIKAAKNNEKVFIGSYASYVQILFTADYKKFEVWLGPRKALIFNVKGADFFLRKRP